ncbi:MAG: hypothetical protein HYT61_02255 [Candidatus Yanofskybacteria bacterium]|nr:hypothetical protein [Candidatus Yanofskybacteria bacterium]
MTPKNTTSKTDVDMEQLFRKAKPLIKIAAGMFAVGKFIQTKINAQINYQVFEEQLLDQYDKLISMGFTHEQATSNIKLLVENILANVKNKNQLGKNDE